jgi:hypothetical protein
MPRIRGQITGSGFIVRSPRILLNDLDDHAGSYSTVQRTGDTSRPGTLATNFDDSTTIIFSETGNPVFPSMLPRGNTFNSQAVDVVGEESDISITAPIRSAQHPTYLHYSPEEQMGPFDENRVMPATDFFLSGTDPDVMPGFTSPLRSKIAIEIDITPQSDTLVMKNVDRRTVAEGGSSIGDKTGFLYYNFVRKEWEQIGLKDPATGGALYFDYAVDTFPSNNLSGTFPSQFVSTWPQSDQSKSFRDQQGYTKIGSPNAAFQAPFKEIYHATASQGLKLSDYISAPFMLEKVKVEFEEINAQRKQGNLPSAFSSSGSNRDIDNYVFFAYRQSRKNRIVDSVSDVSSSERFIIFSGSMSFWNSPSFSTSPIDEAVLSHSPAFSHDFNLPFDNVFRTGQFTGSISLELTPAVTPRQSSGLVYLWNEGFAILGARAAGVRNFWGGGTSCKEFVQSWNVNTFIFTDPFSNFSLVSIDALEPNLDPRSFRKVGSETNSGTTFTLSSVPVFINSENVSSAESPYLLLPEDEIIFGLDCGVTPFGGAKTFSSITGSQMTISSKPCKITLFGSTIIDGVEKLPSLNQNLSSNSVHEIIGAEPVLDQFQIEPISSYYGSYLDEIVTGTMANPSADTTLFTIFDQDNSRRIISRVSLGQAGTTGSLQRFVKMIDQSERTYDSCLPDFNVMLPSATKTASEYSYISENVPLFTGVEWEQEKDLPESIVLQFPFASNPTRNKQKSIGIVGATYTDKDLVESTTYIASSPVDITGRELDDMNILYKTRYEYVSYAARNYAYDINQTFYTLESVRPINLTDGLVSYYRLKATAPPPANVAALEDSVYSNDLTGTPTDQATFPVTHTAPIYNKGSPLFPAGTLDPGRAAYSEFPIAGASTGVRYFEADGDYNDHKMVDDVASPTADVPFSLSCVFYLENLGSTQTLIERRNTSAREYTLEVTSTNYLKFYKGRGNTTTDSRSVLANASGADLDEDTWYHVLVTYNGVDNVNDGSTENVKIYINGVLQAPNTLGYFGSPAIMNTNSLSRLRLGTGMTAGGTGIIPDAATEIRGGRIFSVGIWKNKELSAQDANDIYQAELVGSCVGNVRHRVGAADSFISKAPAFRYGISNTDLEFSSTRWSATSFGQQRDMLEPRLGITVADGAPPIKIRFASGSAIGVDPNNTHTQNLSTFATSSIPWIDDGLFYNREDNPDETLLIV